MKIGSFTKAIALSASVMAAGCSRGPLHEAAFAPNEIVQTMNHLKDFNKEVVDRNYKCFGVDTIEIPKNIVQKPGAFVDKLNSHAKNKVPKVVTGSHMISTIMPCGKSTTIVQQWVADFTNLFINCQGTAINNVLTNEKGNRYFIPVKYFGLPNPDPKLKNAKK
jgi:hypothetical protein